MKNLLNFLPKFLKCYDIGNDHYNYVYFNCDDLNNQNSETCEVWRKIGVFDVERTDPNDNTQTITERRMKLVRGKELSDSFRFKEYESDGNHLINQTNSWEESILNRFLNGNYYNRVENATEFGLKTSSRQMILEAMFYLGGIRVDSAGNTIDTYGTAEDIYMLERGQDTYINNLDSWSCNIGLLYPSDMYMTYAKEVDTDCYNNPYNCHKNYSTYNGSGFVDIERFGYPESGWIFNSNVRDNNSNIYDTFTITPRFYYNSSNDYYDPQIFTIDHNGYMSSGSYFYSLSPRPTLYLSSSVKIIDGDGSINNPYKLGL